MIERRQFLKTIGLTGSAAFLEQCAPSPTDSLIPYFVSPTDVTPGAAAHYATTCRACPAGCGMMVRTVSGRVTKAEGNPQHPVNRGRLCVRGQAAVQQLYHPDRFRTPLLRDAREQMQPISWPDAETLVAGKLRDAKRRGPGRVAWIGRLLTGSLERLTADFLRAVGSDRRLFYEPFDHGPLRRASEIAVGRSELPRYEFGRAEFVLSFGADFLETWMSNVEFTAGYAALRRRRLRDPFGAFVWIAPRLSLTGLNADGWLAARPGSEAFVALALAHAIVDMGLTHASAAAHLAWIAPMLAPFAAEKMQPVTDVDPAAVRAVARQFASALPSLAVGGGASAAGDRQAADLELAVLLLNALAGNIGTTVTYGADPMLGRAADRDRVDSIVRAVSAGDIDVLLVHHANPAFTLPAASGFADALARAPFIVSFASGPDETTDRAHLVLPDHHFLESWDDYSPRAGVNGLQQPAMLPLFDTRATGDALIDIGRQIDEEAARAVGSAAWPDYVRRHWTAADRNDADAEVRWAAIRTAGGEFAEPPPTRASLRDFSAAMTIQPPGPPPREALSFIAYPSTHLFDGRSANEPWLQEIPDPVSKIVWNGWIEVHPDTATRLGVLEGDTVRVSSSHGSLASPVHVYAGMRPDVVAMPIGYGRSGSAHTAGGRGANAIALLPARAADGPHAVWRADSVELRRAGGRTRIISLQAVAAEPPDPRRPVEARMVRPDRVDAAPSAHRAVDLYPPHAHAERRWGMAIDLNACTGCNACVAACYAENNIAVVGEQFCGQGREMAWIRIERHETALAANDGLRRPGAVFLPMLCQQCDEAPCEAVCPVYATYHNPEGLNAQVYARCIGTRYCSNNCPYKVRRFNFARYGWDAPLGEQLNPDVTVRSVGVMEKCTFCVQRIQAAKLDAKRGERPLKDGDVVTACAQTCPADAIVFGDLHDPESHVSRLADEARGYHVLEELNTRPAITYLRRVAPGGADA